jgi:polygalacturonase
MPRHKPSKFGNDAKDTTQLASQFAEIAYYTYPKKFGAKGDGVSNDTTALQNAINASGYSVIDGQGKSYLITSQLSIPSNKTLKNMTIIRGWDGGCVAMTQSQSSNITFENVQFIHNGHTSTGLIVYRCTGFKIKNSYISTKTGFSLQIEGCSDVHIDNVTINNEQLASLTLNYTDGIHIYGGCDGVYITDCDITCSDDAIALTNEYENSSVSGDTIPNYNTIQNIYINNCKVDTNARAITITSGKDRASQSYFNNIHISNIRGFSHGTFNIRKDNQALATEIKNIKISNVKLLAKYPAIQSAQCYFEDLTDSVLRDINLETKRKVAFTNCTNSKFDDFVIKYIDTGVTETVIDYNNIESCKFRNFDITGNKTNVQNLNNCNNSLFRGYSLKEGASTANAFTGTGQGNTFKDIVLNGAKLIDFFISSATFLNNVIQDVVYYNATTASNLTTANTVGSRTFYPNNLIGSATYDPPSLSTGTEASTSVTVTNAALGDFVVASFGVDTQGVKMIAYVSAANTVTVVFRNDTGTTKDLGSSLLKAKVIKS